MNAKTLVSKLLYVASAPTRHWLRESANPDIEAAAEQFLPDLATRNPVGTLNGRFERGIALAADGAVSPEGERIFRVQSANAKRPPYSYLVDLEAENCECLDHAKGHFCKHRIAAHIIELVDSQPSTPGYQTAEKESIIWGVIRHQDEWLGVEILSMQDEQATVKADLPRFFIPVTQSDQTACST